MEEEQQKIQPHGSWSHFPTSTTYYRTSLGEWSDPSITREPAREEKPTWGEVFSTLEELPYQEQVVTYVVHQRSSSRIIELRFWDIYKLAGLQSFTFWVSLDPAWPHTYQNVFRSLWLWASKFFQDNPTNGTLFLNAGEVCWLVEECFHLYPDLFGRHADWEMCKELYRSGQRAAHNQMDRPYTHEVQDGEVVTRVHASPGAVEVPCLPSHIPTRTTKRK